MLWHKFGKRKERIIDREKKEKKGFDYYVLIFLMSYAFIYTNKGERNLFSK